MREKTLTQQKIDSLVSFINAQNRAKRNCEERPFFARIYKPNIRGVESQDIRYLYEEEEDKGLDFDIK